jgi:autotransporter translocation and assembly factor TamB
MALALSLTIPAAAAAQANLTGPWEVTIDSPQGAMTIDADLKQQGEALTGVITSPMGTVELKGTFKNDELSFSYTVPLQGQNLDITMTGKLAGETIDGLVAIAGLGEVPWKAKRKAPGSAAAAAPAAAPAASASAAPTAVATSGEGISGTWDVLMDTPAGQMPFTATFTQTGDKVAGTIAGPGGDIPIAGTVTGNALKLDMNVPTPQGELAIVMTGDLTSTGITGKASTAMGDMTWSATRAK